MSYDSLLDFVGSWSVALILPLSFNIIPRALFLYVFLLLAHYINILNVVFSGMPIDMGAVWGIPKPKAKEPQDEGAIRKKSSLCINKMKGKDVEAEAPISS